MQRLSVTKDIRRAAAWFTAAGLLIVPAAAQENGAARPAAAMSGDCGTQLQPEDVAQILTNALTGRYTTPVTRGFEFWYIPVTMHVVRRSNGSGALAESRLSAALSDMNADYSVGGMVFYRAGPTRFIDSDAFFSNINTTAEIDALRQTDVIPGTVNMYFTENLANEDGGLCGISSFTTSSVQGIVMANSCTGLSSNHSTVPHEVGHYFDLFHTHETAFGAECVNGSNCTVAGDLLCDTPADPVLTGKVNSSCAYTGSDLDSCTSAAFSPQTWNLMSYSTKECRNAFTAGQIDRARATTINLRTELASVSVANDAATFVCADFPDGGTGTPFFPYDTFNEGLQGALSGGCVIIGAGQYAGALTITKHVTLLASRGVVRIGQ